MTRDVALCFVEAEQLVVDLEILEVDLAEESDLIEPEEALR